MSGRTRICAISGVLMLTAAMLAGCEGEGEVSPTSSPASTPTQALGTPSRTPTVASPTPVGTPTVGATPTPAADRIAYIGGDGNIWITTSQGAPQGPITGFTEAGEWSIREIRWSPDGQLIAFTRELDGTWELYVSSADDTDVRLLISEGSMGYVLNFAWSPDSGQIAFTSARTGREEVQVINVDGTGLESLLKDSVLGTIETDEPDWSSFGILVHASEPLAWYADAEKNWVYRVAKDGSTARKLTIEGAPHTPRWSPDGTRIAFIRSMGSHPNVLCVIKADGTEQRCIKNWFENDHIAAWLPDSRGIVFTYDNDEEGERGPFMGLYDVATGERKKLGQAGDRCPSLSPTGTELAFVRSESVWVMDVLTGAAQPIVDGTCPVRWESGG